MEDLELSQEQLDLLVKLGFEGVDVNLDTSLLEYGILYSEKWELVIYGYIIDETDAPPPRFIIEQIDKKDIKSALEDMDKGFYKWVGSTPEEYKNEPYLPYVIQDINSYNSALRSNTHISGWEYLDEMFETLRKITNES